MTRDEVIAAMLNHDNVEVMVCAGHETQVVEVGPVDCVYKGQRANGPPFIALFVAAKMEQPMLTKPGGKD